MKEFIITDEHRERLSKIDDQMLSIMIDALVSTLHLHSAAATNRMTYVNYKDSEFEDCPLCESLDSVLDLKLPDFGVDGELVFCKTGCPWFLFADRSCCTYDVQSKLDDQLLAGYNTIERPDQLAVWVDAYKAEAKRRDI